MTLADVAQISQVIGSAGVITSLIFVSVQLRHNAKATRSASHHGVSDSLNDINLLWAKSPDAARIWLAGMGDRRSLNPEERWRFDSMLRAYLHVCETMHLQASLGAGDADIVMAEEFGLRSIFASPSVQEWWAENPFGFSPQFRRHVETFTTGRSASLGSAR